MQILAHIFLVGCDNSVAKGHVADGEIKRTVGKSCRFKALARDFRLRMRLGGDACRKFVQLDTENIALFAHCSGHDGKESSCAAGRLQNVAALKAQTLKPRIDSFGHFRRRIVSIEYGCTRRSVLRVRQMLLQRVILLLPCLIERIKSFGKASEAAVASEEFLLLGACVRSCRLQSLQDANRGKISCKDGTLAARRRHVRCIINGTEIDRRSFTL